MNFGFKYITKHFEIFDFISQPESRICYKLKTPLKITHVTRIYSLLLNGNMLTFFMRKIIIFYDYPYYYCVSYKIDNVYIFLTSST